MSVRCNRCGEEWPRDPALEVPCPTCGAAVGRHCRRPSEHRVFGGGVHPDRDRAAMAAGNLAKCSAPVTLAETYEGAEAAT